MFTLKVFFIQSCLECFQKCRTRFTSHLFKTDHEDSATCPSGLWFKPRRSNLISWQRTPETSPPWHCFVPDAFFPLASEFTRNSFSAPNLWFGRCPKTMIGKSLIQKGHLLSYSILHLQLMPRALQQ